MAGKGTASRVTRVSAGAKAPGPAATKSQRQTAAQMDDHIWGSLHSTVPWFGGAPLVRSASEEDSAGSDKDVPIKDLLNSGLLR